MSRADDNKRRPRTRQAVKELKEATNKKKTRRSARHRPSSLPGHIKTCFICYSEAERRNSIQRRRRGRLHQNSVSVPSTSCRRSLFSEKNHSSTGAVNNFRLDAKTHSVRVDLGRQATPKTTLKYPDLEDERFKPQQSEDSRKTTKDVNELRLSGKRNIAKKSACSNNSKRSSPLLKRLPQSARPLNRRRVTGVDKSTTTFNSRDRKHIFAVVQAKTALASTTKPPQQPSPRPPAPVPPPAGTPPKPVNNIPLPPPTTYTTKPQAMTTSTGPLTRLQAHSLGATEGLHHQVSVSNVDEAMLDQCFQIAPKWHYIKSNHEETSQWLDSASFESILFELLYFAHDQGHGQHKEMEAQFEKDLERAMNGIEKLDCLDAFCKTFIRDNQFRPTGKVMLTSSGKDEKYSRLFRMINSDLHSLQRQHRILSMVCAGTADYEVHTLAQRENLRKLIEDLVTVVHPSDRATFSEVYKMMTENATYDKRSIKPQLSSLKLVSLPDTVVPYGGPIMAGGSLIRCDALEQKIRAKLPSLIIKMHFSEKLEDQKWTALSHADDSGIAEDPGAETPRPRSRDRGEEKPGSKASGASGKSAGKRKHEEAAPTYSKRHCSDLRTRDPQPPDAHVVSELYKEHVAQLICSLSSTPLGYIKHARYTVSPGDDRDGSASVSVLGMIVSGEDIYLTKMDASHDYLDSLVETFRIDQLSFSCLANPLKLYKGTHLKALLLFLRHVCLNFPRTTYFLSD